MKKITTLALVVLAISGCSGFDVNKTYGNNPGKTAGGLAQIRGCNAGQEITNNIPRRNYFKKIQDACRDQQHLPAEERVNCDRFRACFEWANRCDQAEYKNTPLSCRVEDSFVDTEKANQLEKDIDALIDLFD